MSKQEKNDFKKYLDPAIVSKLSSLELKARFIVEGFMLGLHRSPYHGFSVEFSQHRPYIQGDNPKDIDWKVYAKSDKFFVKQYEEETNLKCHILLDISKSMSFASEGNIKKIEYASMLVGALSYLMLNQKDATGLVLYSDKIHHFLPPKASNIYLTEILKKLSTVTPDGNTQTAACLNTIAESINKKGLIIIISDLLDDISKVLTSLKHFRFKQNEVVVFQVLDPQERYFAFSKDAIFKDLETDEEMTTQPHLLQKSYQEAFNSFLKSIKQDSLNYGIDYNLLDTSVPFDKALYAYLQKRIRLH
ncbi:MAG TPA: DUF58 domain-containing protein [Ignavibacteriaceae bacterium]|nr:DUF58 domain-containing protein [Ignavibacteriaceae bacterium]HOJ17001.1 DUF58 domain-containing protein [Ignavibacteriaceae bacterium]HPO55155.1 DUF58 domain-containing protein [Ignavibacteriaceae bacterium]